MYVLNWQTGYIVSAAIVCKYIATYVIRKCLKCSICHFEVLADNDPTTVNPLSDNIR